MGSEYAFPVMLERHPDIQRLSPTEKLALVTELWDDLAAHPVDVPVTPEQLAELDRRIDEYRKDPTKVTTWEAIQQRLLGRGK
jgi:putative addiction module component (TIGR02574 family)